MSVLSVLWSRDDWLFASLNMDISTSRTGKKLYPFCLAFLVPGNGLESNLKKILSHCCFKINYSVQLMWPFRVNAVCFSHLVLVLFQEIAFSVTWIKFYHNRFSINYTLPTLVMIFVRYGVKTMLHILIRWNEKDIVLYIWENTEYHFPVFSDFMVTALILLFRICTTRDQNHNIGWPQWINIDLIYLVLLCKPTH